MKKLRILTLVLAVLLVLPILAACAGDDTAINVYSLNGTTGFGMAKMMDDAKAQEHSQYTFFVESDVSLVTAALINGDADIAALPTNAAANLYQKTQGGIKVLAINTLGCLYLLTTDGSTVSSFEDLRGKTVYAPAQNPTFILKYLCQANGLTVGKDVIIDSTSYAQPANLRDAVANGSVALAVLPEPMVTMATASAKQNNVTVNNTMDLTEQWNKVSPEGSLVQGCIVVRTEFLQQHPNAVARFLEEYEASINYLSTNTAEAAQMIATHKIFANATVAEKAIPKCNVCYVDGEDMKARMQTYLGVLFQIAPASVGGVLPSEDLYYVKK
ncbi:MAG: ABC transporter substrate-binding protein [Clostridia bacterium]|nr:ABC transporter substrate-binding protein [Clostridia bacterium]